MIYSSAERAVFVSLRRGMARGQERDALSGVENVVGSRFDDKFIGDAKPNRTVAGAGNDTCAAETQLSC